MNAFADFDVNPAPEIIVRDARWNRDDRALIGGYDGIHQNAAIH